MGITFQIDTSFNLIDSCIGNGEPIPSGWLPIPEQPIMIMVGGMGVGKTTTIDRLISHGAPIQLLPNRRELTVQLIVAPQQRAEGKPVSNLPRLERIPYIKRYQKKYPGGLAHAISQLSVAPTPCVDPLVFDGLRGVSEIEYAVKHMPLAYFIMLTTPDFVRVQRLLKRLDPYDKIGFNPPEMDTLKDLRDFISLGVPNAKCIFSPEEEQALLDLVRSGEVKMSDLADKLSLIWAERSMYNLEETRQAVLDLAPYRSLVINTTNTPPNTVLYQTLQFMGDYYTEM